MTRQQAPGPRTGRRYSVFEIGTSRFTKPAEFEILHAIVLDQESGEFFLTFGGERFSTPQAARLSMIPLHEDFECEIHWRDSLTPLADEQGCAICGVTLGRPMEAKERHPQRICCTCTLHAETEQGQALTIDPIAPEPAAGKPRQLPYGVQLTLTSTGAPHPKKEFLILGHPCQASEAHFGGIVVELISPKP